MQRKENVTSKEKKKHVHISPVVPSLGFVASKTLLRIILIVVSYIVQTVK